MSKEFNLGYLLGLTLGILFIIYLNLMGVYFWNQKRSKKIKMCEYDSDYEAGYYRGKESMIKITKMVIGITTLILAIYFLFFYQGGLLWETK